LALARWCLPHPGKDRGRESRHRGRKGRPPPGCLQEHAAAMSTPKCRNAGQGRKNDLTRCVLRRLKADAPNGYPGIPFLGCICDYIKPSTCGFVEFAAARKNRVCAVRYSRINAPRGKEQP
jgi:hypothetical protein